MTPDLFTGWGGRTLSKAHPSYNPLGYHLGTIWPVEHATFALGFKRYGLDDHLERLVTGLFHAARHFCQLRLPELVAGHGTDERAVPGLYPQACSPQAWSASATIQLFQVMLGIYPFAATHVLALVRPRLPAWIETLTLQRLRVGDAVISLRFRREADGSASHEVVERKGRLFVVVAPSPDDVEQSRAGWGERFEAWAFAHAPGRLARAARISLGDID